MKKRSRLQSIEEKKNIKQAVFFTSLTAILILVFIFLGFPSLVKLAVFLGDLKSRGVNSEEINTLPIAPPTLEPLPDATKSAKLSVKGFAKAGATVKVFLDGVDKAEIVADDNGEFLIKQITLNEGENKIKARVISDTGKESDFSQELVVIVDNKVPEVTIDSPLLGQSFFDRDNPITVKGKTEKDVSVFINNHMVIVEAEGNFSDQLRLTEGENTVIVLCRDLAGNETKTEIKVNYTP